METLWRTLACTVMVAMVIAGASESHEAEKSAQSQGQQLFNGPCRGPGPATGASHRGAAAASMGPLMLLLCSSLLLCAAQTGDSCGTSGGGVVGGRGIGVQWEAEAALMPPLHTGGPAAAAAAAATAAGRVPGGPWEPGYLCRVLP
ncbi:unnamed protein product [Merluccius merluccius]